MLSTQSEIFINLMKNFCIKTQSGIYGQPTRGDLELCGGLHGVIENLSEEILPRSVQEQQELFNALIGLRETVTTTAMPIKKDEPTDKEIQEMCIDPDAHFDGSCDGSCFLCATDEDINSL